MKNIFNTNLEINEDGIWYSPGIEPISYSDGPEVEEYLQSVFLQVADLSSESGELDRHIKDWPSQYHLSSMRANLLRQFNFKGDERVLEVGAGCGAITRFLGETFSEVIAVEGSMTRSRLARLRTTEQENVNIVCAPFQELEFSAKFDVVICIGVFEYSPSYVSGDNPFATFLSCLKNTLSEDGVLILALENQFGLKYFSSSLEDHTGVMFDGIEGYPRKKVDVKTFGRGELNSILKEEFEHVDFYYPYPDYKLPVSVLSDQFLELAKPAELIGRCRIKDRRITRKPLFNETFALVEISRNGLLSHFANSFLVLAKNDKNNVLQLNSLGVIFNNERQEKFRTMTHFEADSENTITSRKILRNSESQVKGDFFTLSATGAQWETGYSLNYFLLRSLYANKNYNEFPALCAGWLAEVKSFGNVTGGKIIAPGSYFDANWSNYIINDCGGKFIDLEWSIDRDLELKFLVFKSAVNFLDEVYVCKMADHLMCKRYNDNLIKIFQSLQIDLSRDEIVDYYDFMTEVCKGIFGPNGYDYKKKYQEPSSLPGAGLLRSLGRIFART